MESAQAHTPNIHTFHAETTSMWGYPQLDVNDLYGCEKISIKINSDREIHCYPTDKIICLGKKFGLNTLFYLDNSTSKIRPCHDPVIIDKFSRIILENLQNLDISEDTTHIYSEAWLEKNALIQVQANVLKLGVNLRTIEERVDLMFVINFKGQLMMAKKMAKAPGGRVHHSSLASKKNVYCAGICHLTRNDSTVEMTFREESGHYLTEPHHLDYVKKWFTNEKILYKVTKDAIPYLSEYRILKLEWDERSKM